MDHTSTKHQLSSFPESYWLSHPIPHFPKMTADSKTEIAVIGAGIVGVLTAYLLAKAGKEVTLVEARELLTGVTGNTTAKITVQHSLIYNQLIKNHGQDNSKLYYEANLDGLKLIQELVEELQIDCDLEIKEAVVYSTTAKGVIQIRKEAKAYEKLGIEGLFSKDPIADLPFETTASLTLPNQAQFHPVKFLSTILKEIQRLGGKIYEHTRAVEIQDQTTVVMENGSQLESDYLIVATHYPFNDLNAFYFTKLSTSRSYAIATKVTDKIPPAMYINAESPKRSLRSIQAEDGTSLLLIGGESHPTGKSESNSQKHYDNLKEFGEKWFDLQEVLYHWSAQDMTTLDQIPYIGQMSSSSSRVLVATGFQKWGMTMGALSAKLLTDLIIGEKNRYSELFDPTRSKFKSKDIQEFIKKNTVVGKDLLVSKVQSTDKSLNDLRSDEGGLVEVNGQKVGGYRDSNGQIHLVKTTCTHMGCGLNWNEAERSWDCPCHGSRFSYSGEVLDGPAVESLEKIDKTK